jgi:hypothetical protein
MAISGWSIWEVHSAGNDANGGGFDPNATMTSTLSATSATTTNPVITASNYTFVSDDIGHFLYIKSGNSWYPGWYKILSISSGSAIVEAGIGNATQGNGALNILQGIGSSNTLSSGTWAVDYSQKPTPYKVYTDLYTYTNTGVNSAAQPFTPNLIGNVLNVTGGTNYFTGRFVINSIESGNAQLDRTIAASGTSGGQANLGGALGTVPFTLKTIKDFASSSFYIKVFMKNDNTYNVSVNSGSLNYTSTEFFNLIGYGSVRGDNQKVTVSINNNNISWITGGAGYVPQLMKWFNIKVTGNGYTTSTFAWSFVQFSGYTQQFTNCEFSDMTLLGGAYGVSCHFDRCYFKNLTGSCNDSIHSLNNCTIEGCSNPQFWGSRVYNCLFINNGGNCVFANGGMLPGIVKGCTFYNNSTCVWIHNNCHGSNTQHTAIYNNIFANNSGRAIQGIGLSNCGEHTTAVVQANAFYLNSGGNFNNGVNAYNVNMVLSIDNVILSASPFISTTNKDFRLNNVIGGGASCIGKGSVSVYYNVPFVNALDIGAVQSPSNNLDKTLGTLNKPITIKAGTTSYTEFIYLSTTGYTSSTTGLKAFYIRPGSNNTQITLASQTVNGAWVSGGFVEIDPVNMPGLYRFDVPNAVLSSGASSSVLQIINQSNNDKAIISYKFQDPVNLNLTQAVPTSNTDQTVGDALNAARAYGFGKWAINGNNLEYYNLDGTVVIKTLGLDNPNYPRSRGFIEITDGLILNLKAYDLNSYSGSGTLWNDLSVSNYDCILYYNPTFVLDAGGAIQFNGSQVGVCEFGTNVTFTQFTYNIWVKITQNSAQWQSFINVNNDNFLLGVSNLGINSYNPTYNAGYNIPLNTWINVCQTYVQGTAPLIYVNGILIHTATSSNLSYTGQRFSIGAGVINTVGPTADEFLYGRISEILIYNKRLSAIEIYNNYMAKKYRYGL